MLSKQVGKKVFLETKVLKEMQRNMIKNFLDTIILANLRNSSALSGYDVIEFIHRKFGILVSSGTVYALLYSMERKELIKSTLTQRKRVYTLTDKGRDTINAISKSKEEIQRLMKTCISG
jgi:DNA-binding PadR family transcriptional regulator